MHLLHIFWKFSCRLLLHILPFINLQFTSYTKVHNYRVENIMYSRLRSCHSAISRRQVVLHALCTFWYTLDTGAVDCTGRSVDDTYDEIPALPQQPSRTFISAVYYPVVTFRHYTRHVDISVSAASRGDVHIFGTRVELHGFVVLLFYITHDHWSRRLHSGRRAGPEVQTSLQTNDNR